ncbi:MAG: GAF domain-containing protein [Pseudobdellovibrionaceae bacterium]
MDQLPEINWVGFYFLQNDTLKLGPFQGLPACLDIKMGRGVCGASAFERKTIIVPNIEEFPGHIACDSNSKSEIVVPLIKLDQFSIDPGIIGVLDIDSPILNRFSVEDQLGLEKLMRGLLEASTSFKL